MPICRFCARMPAMNAKKRLCLPRAAFFLLTLLQAAGFIPSLHAQATQRREFNALVSSLPTAASSVSLEETGAWQEIINRAAFAAFRGAEVYRGGISIRLTSSENVAIRFLPGGILEISSGLLDFIDGSILGSGNLSARRLRQLDLERERMLMPFIAAEAGVFAADAEFRAYRRIAASSGAAAAQRASSRQGALAFNKEETLQIDVCAQAILRAAGSFISYTEWLDNIFEKEAKNPVLKEYIARFPDYASRKDALAAELFDPLNGARRLQLMLNSLKTGFNTTDALIAAEDLSGRMPGVVYVERLKALLAHRAWEESAAKGSRGAAALSMLPIAQPLEGGRSALLKAQAERISGGSSLFGCLPLSQAENDARSDRLYKQALEAYANVEAAYSDFTIQSARAFLAAQKAQAREMDAIIADAARAALEEAGTSSMLARANHARLLYLTGRDAELSARIMEGIFPQAEAASDSQVPGKEALFSYVSPGFPGDSRLALLFYAEIAARSGDSAKAARAAESVLASCPDDENVEEVAGEDGENAVPGENTVLRSAALGDDTDIVESMWGQPGEIAFNTESETWTYPENMAETVFVPVPRFDSETGLPAGMTRLSVAIAVFIGSPVSFPGDLRTGDSREAFEEILGAPSYRADDCLVYFYDGIRVKLRVTRDGAVSSFFICF